MNNKQSYNSIIRSTSRKSYESINKAVYNLPLSNLTFNDVRMHLFSMRNTIKTVGSYNCQLIITYLGTSYTVTITNGYYSSITSLLSELKTRLDGCGAGITFTCTCDPITFKVTIVSTNNFTLSFNQVPTQYLLGFTAQTTYTGNLTYTGALPYDLRYTDFVDLRINEFGIRISIPIDVETGYQVDFSNKHLNLLNGPASNSNFMTIELYDEYGNLLETTSDYVIHFKLR